MADKKRSLPPWLAKKGEGKDDKKGKKAGLKDKAKKKGGFVPFKKKGK